MARKLTSGGWRKRPSAFSQKPPAATPSPLADIATRDRVIIELMAPVAQATIAPSLKLAMSRLVRGLVTREAQNLFDAAESGTDGDPCAELVAWRRTIEHLLARLVAALPRGSTPSRLTVPVIDLIGEPAALIEIIVTALLPFADQPQACGAATAQIIKSNLLDIAGLPEEAIDRNPRRITWPTASKLAGDALASAYLAGTGFETLFTVQVPFPVPMEKLLEHGKILAPSGWGKTALAENLLLDILDQHHANPPAVFVLEGTRTFLPRLERLRIWNGAMRDRLRILDPEDDVPPSLNVLDPGVANLDRHPPGLRAALLANADDTLAFLFSAFGQEMTAQQDTAVNYVIQLLKTFPNATLDTLRDIIADPAPSPEASDFADHYAQLDRYANDFFRDHFFRAMKTSTRMQIGVRLAKLYERPIIRRMFCAPRNTFNFYESMRAGHWTLINASTYLLGDTGAALFGKWAIAQFYLAAYQRSAVIDREPNQRPALLLIDECHQYLIEDKFVHRIMDETRKYKAAVILLTQRPNKLGAVVKEALSSASVGFIGPLDSPDDRVFAPSIHATPSLLGSLTQSPRQHGHFAGYIRGITPTACRVRVPYGALFNASKMTDQEHAALRVRNRALLGARPTVTNVTQPATPQRLIAHPLPALPAPRPQAATQPTLPMVTGRERVGIPDFGITVDAALDPEAVTTLRVATIQHLTKARAPFAKISLEVAAGSTITIDVPLDLAGRARLSLSIGTLIAFEPCVLEISSVKPVLVVGRGFIAGRFRVTPVIPAAVTE